MASRQRSNAALTARTRAESAFAAGCETVEGVGEDIENLGDEIEDEARDSRR